MTVEPDFQDIAITCNGMLAPAIYRRIYQAGLHRPGGSAVEVGTAHGAATVALALGLKHSGLPGKVYTFERAEGGWRSKFGGRGENIRIIEANLARFGVEDRVELIVGEVEDTAAQLPADLEIGALMLDADGRLERDFALFFSRVLPGAPVIIDDCADVVRLRRTGLLDYRIDAKMRLTYRLIDYFKRQKMLSDGELMRATYFGRKLDDAGSMDPASLLAIYGSLVLTDGRTNQPTRRLVIDAARALFPSMTLRLQTWYRDRRAVATT